SYAVRTPTNDEPFTVWTIAPFTNFALGPLATSGSVGFTQISSKRVGTLNSITTFSNISYAFPVGSASLSVDQGFSETFTTGQNFGVVKTRGITAGYSYPVASTANLLASVFYRENNTTGLTVGNVATQAYGASLLFTMPILRWLGFNAQYRY